MHRFWLPLALAVTAVGFSVAEFAYRYPQLPDRVASHFNAAGQADGWTSKRQFATMWFAGIAIVGFTFSMACLVVSVAPASVINLPRKDYWLTPERAAGTRRMIIQRMLWFTAALMLFMGYLSHEMIEVNLKGGGRLTIWTPLAAFLAFTVLWCGETLWRFQRATPPIEA
jgi:uncharacterized membrane protein